MIAITLVFAIYLIPSKIFAQDECIKKLNQIFGDHFANKYSRLGCAQNVACMVDELKKQNVDLSEAKVLWLSPDGGKIKPMVARGSIKSWPFHVVLENKGLIYDFDYTQKPTVEPVKEYFEKMYFGGKAEAASDSNIIVREIPASEYTDAKGRISPHHQTDYLTTRYKASNANDYVLYGNQASERTIFLRGPVSVVPPGPTADHLPKIEKFFWRSKNGSEVGRTELGVDGNTLSMISNRWSDAAMKELMTALLLKKRVSDFKISSEYSSLSQAGFKIIKDVQYDPVSGVTSFTVVRMQ